MVLLLAFLSSVFGFDRAFAATDLVLAPPPFQVNGKQAVPVDFQEERVAYLFDVTARKAYAHARISFVAGREGFPLMDLVAEPARVLLNGAESRLPLITDPDHVTQLRMLDSLVPAGTLQVLDIDFVLPAQMVTFTAGGVRFGTFMNDLAQSGREFLEQYAPSSFEFDHFKLSMDIEVRGGSSPEQIFSNGTVTQGARGWHVEFPPYFTTSSVYIHLTDAGMKVAQGIYPGLQRPIPITVYSGTERLATDGLQSAKVYLAELEKTYGPFLHPTLTVYLTLGGGGMEYCGATMTSAGALGHELTHSWFARGVMPANGNAGWIDEAIATWRGNGYPRLAPGEHPAVNLAGYPPYRRQTPGAAYNEGARLIAELDGLFAAKTGGMRPLLRDLFAVAQRQVITTPMFQKFLEERTGTDLRATFDRYVYGNVRDRSGFVHRVYSSPAEERALLLRLDGRRRPYTAEEILQYR